MDKQNKHHKGKAKLAKGVLTPAAVSTDVHEPSISAVGEIAKSPMKGKSLKGKSK